MNFWLRKSFIVLLFLLTMGFSVEAIGSQINPVSIQMKSPVDSETYSGFIPFEAVIKGGSADQYLTVTVECFGTRRFFSLLPSISLLGQMPDHELHLEQWPVKEGSHRLKVTVCIDGNQEPLAEKEIQFTIKKSEIDMKTIDRIRDDLYYAANSIEKAEQEFSIAQSAFRLDPDTIEERNTAAHKTHACRLDELKRRIRAIRELSNAYVKQFEYEKAKEIMDTALAIYMSEMDKSAIHPLSPNELSLYRAKEIEYAPDCYEGLAGLSTRLGDALKAVWAWEMVINWYRTQLEARKDLSPELRKKCIRLTREAYDHLADVYIILQNNRLLAQGCRDAAAALHQ